MKRIFSFADGSQAGRQWNGEFIASLVKKMLILLGIMLLPNMSNAAIRRFEVTKTSYVYIDNGAKADPGSLPAAVDSVNKYSTDSCAIIFKLKANDTIKVTSYVAKEISNETYTLIDGGKNGAKVKPASGNYFIISGANHVVLKNMEFLNDGGYNALKIESSVVDTITNCKFIDNSSSYGALNLVSSTVTSINNCLFSGNNIGLTTDASASVTVSDCQFLDNNRMGVSGNGNKNLILRNCTISGSTEGMRNFYGKAYNCVFKNNESASYMGSGNFYNCIFSQNSVAAMQGGANVINKCRFTENGVAINAVQSSIDSICNSYIGNNETGIYISQTQVKNIIGDTIVSNKTHGIYIGGQCTHIYDNVISGNNIGMEIIRTTIDSICGNTIASNKTSGVKSTGRGVLNVFSNNYIGTNPNFEALGNGEDGVTFLSSSTYPSEFKNNVIGNNGRYGIGLEGSTTPFTIESCHIGMAPDSTPMPNAEGGINIYKTTHKTVLKNSSIAMNGGTGVKATMYGELSLSGCSFYANQGYGVYFASESTGYKFSVDSCVFDQNDSSAIYTSYPYAGEGNSSVTSSVTNTLFLNTKKKLAANKAIETNNPLPTPVITSIKEDENGYLVISGKVESEGKSFVELYLCDNGEETTSKFLASDSTDAEGNFSINAQRTTFSVIIVATASSSGETSAFSRPYTYFNGNRGNYYVKENSKGDGSNWKAAMSGKDFVKLLPLAPAGVTFHVAAGTYDLKELSGGYSYVYINNPVTIIGGYPADAQTGASSAPLVNTTLMKTGYFRLNTGGNVVFDGLKFDNENYRGAYDANSNGKYGLCVTLKNSIVEGNENNADAVYAAHGGKTILYNDIITGSYTYSAVFSRGDSLIINKCHISGAQLEGGVGLSGGYLNIDSTSITENAENGIYLLNYGSAIVTNSVITKNGGDGISAGSGSITLKNNRIGVDGKGNAAGNRIGVNVYSNTTGSIIEDNIIAGNDSTGIIINGGTTNVIKGNYIGTDKDFNNLGNGSDGLFIGGRCSVTFQSSLDSANYIGFNKKHGIYSQAMTLGNVSFNYIGVTPQGDPMPNGKYGVYLETSRSYTTIKGNLIGFNGEGGVHYEDNNKTITENLFFGTKGKAISDNRTTYKLAYPAITKITRDEDVIRVEGTTDTFWVSTIELFYTNGDPQTAHEFLGSTETDNTGAFSFAIPRERLSKYGKDICLSATATYSSTGTSALSDPFCCEDCMCKLDTTPVTDTIQVGASFLGKTYTVVGVNDSIFETLKNVEGCDSVVMHRLVVKPDPTVFNYYVKMESHGRGDGSDWENAMDSIAFAACLPLAPDGVTFHVAEGMYTPIYNESLVRPIYPAGRCYAIKSSVTIRGGYPATAEGDAVSEPDKYKTIFNGDILGEDVVDETLDENGYPLLTRTSALDNTYSLFHIVQPDQQTITFDGVVMRSAERAVDIGNSNKTVNVLNCTFYYNDNVANLGYGNVSVSVYHSLVEKNRTGFSLAAVKDVVFDDVVFKNNLRSLLYASRSSGTSEPCSVTINNVRAIGNGDGFSMMGYNTTVTNSEFESNLTSNTNLLNIMDCQNGLSVKIEDCRFLQNKGTLIYSHHSDLSIENCSFEKNEVGEKKMFCIETPSEYIQAGSGRYVINGSVFKENDASTLIDCHGEETTLNFVNSSMEDNKASVSVISSNVDSLIIDHVKFNHNSLTPGKDFLSAYIASGYVGIKNSEFSNNISALDPQDIEGTNGSDLIYMRGAGEGNTSYVEGNAFWGNQVGYIVTTYMVFDTAVISNNTIVSNELYSSVLNYSHVTDAQQLSLNNNTIIGNAVEDGTAVYLANADVNFTGNIIVGNVDTTGATTEYIGSNWSAPEFNYNILPYFLDRGSLSVCAEEIPLDKNILTFTNPEKSQCVGLRDTKDRNEEILTTLFEGTYDKKTNLFTPVLKNNGGPTPTVALKNDLLIDGTSIRFPLKETVVSTDQRGETRVDPTCMGAYEITCSDTETTVQDTVALGDPYTFNGEDLSGLTSQVGIHTVSDTIKSTSGCDSIINLQLAVRPQKKDGGYYVKVDGTGDGSDWENAMSPKDFATYLPLVYDGDTFHVAAGTYRCEVEDPVYGHTFCVNKDVTIIGGYPDTVTIVGTPSSPDVYTTLLTANNGGEEYMYMYMNSSFPSIGSFAKSEPSLVRVVGQPHVTLFGLTLSGVKNANDGAVSLLDGAALDMDRCVVTKNQASAIYAKNADVKVTNSEFSLNFTGVGSVFNLSDSKLEVSTSTIYENFSNDTFCVDGGSKGAVAYLNSSSAVFVNNTIVKNRASAGAVFAADGSTLDLTNNTITGNMIEPGAGTAGSVFNFIGGSSNMKLFGNMIVANDKTSMTGTATITSSDYNIFSPDITIEKGANDMTMSNTQVPYVMDVENAYGEEDLYIPILRDNGGITPTVALFQSLFDGGAVLSIPSDVRAVDFDQRGFVRKDTSCVGAFEFPTYVDYYVKTRSHGDGSGRDWDNAMGDTSFARYFAIAPTGATFHVAAGLYHPMFDCSGKLVSGSGVLYKASRPINVIGSYPANAKEGDTPDALKYKTILSADLMEDDIFSPSQETYTVWSYDGFRNNAIAVMSITLKQAGACHLYGLTFKGNFPLFRGSSSALLIGRAYETVAPTSFVLDSCVFTKTYAGVYSTADSVVMRSCRFDTISSVGFSHSTYSMDESYFFADGCSFTSSNNGLSYLAQKGLLRVQNTTFSNVLYNALDVSPSLWKQDLTLQLYNNTFSHRKGNVNSIYLPNYVNTELKGNIFNTGFTFHSSSDAAATVVASDYNLYAYSPDTTGSVCPKGEHDLMVEPKDLVGIMDGSLSDDAFISTGKTLSDNDMVSVVKILEDKLPDGSFIRLPLEEAFVSVDAIGKERNKQTCMGAYEMDCRPDTFVVGDTIQIGQSFQGVTYDTVGNYKIYGPDSVNVIGCPLTIEHHLYVTPSFEGSGFYVKTERTGKGTGADWDNAMNGADFLYGLPLVEAGATFHVAQGSYNMNKLAGAASVTAVNPVSVIGGYKNTAKMGDGKNAAFETNFVSDSSFILNIISPAAAGEVPAGIYDLRMSGVQLNVKGNMNVEVDSCTFEKFDVAVTMDSTAALALKATSFDGGGKNATAVYTESLKSVSVENCSFTGISAGEDGKGYALRCGNTSGDVTIKNTTFAGNQTASLIEIGHLDGKTYLYNNTIAGNGGTECTLSLGDAVMKGNIFSGNVASKLSTTSLENAYNVFSSTDEFASDLDVKLPVEQLPLYLDGTYDANTGIFDAHLNANGGFVKTVAILKDSFPDHSVARFPIENTTVDHDARGVVRLDLLCYGAYELYDGVRDTITLPILDTVCLGMNYEKRGWNIETSQLEAGTSYLDTVFVKGVISTDTIYTLELRVMTFEKLRLDSVAVSPTRCPGSGSGMVYLGTSCNRTGSMSVTIMDADTETKDTVLSQSYPFNYADVVYDDLGVGKYMLRVTPISQCIVLDTTIALEVKDRGDLQALPCEDTIMVRCANNPENYLAVALTGFHPSMKVYFDDELITDEDANPHAYVYYEDDAAFSAKGEVRLSAIAPGVHTVTATDEECDKKYELKEFVVAVEESYAIEMQLVDYRRDSLKCGLDYGFAKFNLKSGVNTVFSLKSDKGYQKQLTFTEQMDSTFTFSDLSAGNYQALFKKNDPNCSDSVSASFSIFSPEPLTLSLTSNGAACAEGAVTVTAAGGAGKYIYHWTNPMGEKFDSVSTKLNDVSAGDYICVVEDSTGCLSRPDTLSIVPNVEDLSELTKDTTIIKNITCFKGENGTIEVHFSTDNHKQSVACVVTNDEDGSQTKIAGAYADNKGKLIINTLGVGSYTYEVYYGTESCRLDTNSIKGAFSIAAKEVPFSMTPLVDELKQTCFDPADGRTSNVATGWEDDYTAWMIVDDGDVHDDNKIKPITNGSETKLIAPYGLGNGHSYYYLVKDACGSEMTTNSVNFPAYEPLTLTVDTFVDSVVCARSSDAMIRFTVSGGIGDNHKAFVNDKVFTEKGTILCDNIGKGDYYVSYRYKSNLVKETCKDSVGVYVRIAGPDTLAIQYTLTGNCATSKIIPEVTGESGAYTYLWSNGDTTIAGEVNSPFETMEEGKTYSLTVSDVKGCDQYTKTITMPSASDLPSLTHSVYGESQKCHGVDNGLIVIKPTLSKKMDYAITATSYYHLIDVEDSTSHEFVLNPDDSYVTPQTLAPGKYRVTTRLGSMDCDMGVDPVSSVVTVDSLQPLKIQSDFENKPMTCLIPNGESKFTVDGWTYTHTANLYIESNNNLTMYKGMIKPGTYMPNYVGNFDVDSLSGGHYTLIVMDKCSNSDTADFTIDQYIPKVKLDASSMENSICINQPTGKLNFEIYGWTKDHTVNFNRGGRNYAGENLKNADTVVVDTVNGQPRATVSMSKLPSGSWRAIVTNECHDELLSDTLLLGGIDPYKVELVKNDSKLHLDCPYHSDGKIALKVSGGFTDADFTGFATRSVTYYGPTGKTVDSLVLVPDTSYYYVPVYDSTDMIVQYDTTFKFISRDTVSFLTDTIRNGALVLNINLNDPNISRIDTLLVSDTVISQITVPEVTFDTTIHSDSLVIATLLADSIVFNYDMVIVPDTIIPQKVNSEGELVFDTIMRLDSVLVGKKMPVYGYMDSLETTQIDPDKYPTGGKVGDYLYVDLPAGTYRFTYKSALEGCTDKYNFDTEVTKPAPVRLEREVMPISCSSSEDGVISLAPRRGGKDYPYIVGHDSTESAYNINRLYVKDVVDGKDTIVEYKPGGVTLTYRIDTLYDRSDLKDITWSYKSYKKDASWAALNNIVFPDSADFMEEVYYSKGDTIRTPVYSNTHLESFWADYMGEFSAANVVTISNLAPGFYAVLVTDSSKCQYRDTFEVKLPDKPLKIDSVLFDSNLAECDPTKRQILAYVSGGWGEYNFTFSDTAKVKSLGEQSDGFRGGEATHYDKNTLSGWGVSQFLDPGLYTVVVLDEQGCMVKSENQYSVKSKFKLHIDSTRTKCPEDPTAEVMVKFVTKPDKADLSYTIVEYVSPCRNDTLDDCRDYRLDTLTKTPVKPVNDEIAIELSSLKMRSKTHGLFVYANDDGHCGSYVQGTVVDTVPIFKSSMKSVQHVSCNGDKNGKIELYVSGGDEPYAVQRNSSWHGTDEVALFENLSLVDTSFKMVLRDPTDSTYAKDTIIKNYYLTLNNLEAGDYYLTVIDARGCRSVMGDTSTYNEKLVVKQPDTLMAMFDASVVCPEASVTKGGNVFFQNVKGGTAPYTFSLNHMREGKADSLVIDCAPISMIYGGDLKSTILMEVSDKNGCRVNEAIRFRNDSLQVDSYDFWATSWYDFGDVVALIDICGPEQTFDSVSYVFYDKNNKVDPKIKILDKRMYIYDLESDKVHRDLLYQSLNTKAEVPDSYFEKWFKLRDGISKGQARHLNFFKYEDASIDLKNKDNLSKALAEHSVLMKAYFLGCEYQYHRNDQPLRLINPNNPPELDSIGQKYQIISLEASPNPFEKESTISVKATFSGRPKSAVLYIYHIDGKTNKQISIDVNTELKANSNGEFVYTHSEKATELFGEDMPGYTIIYLRTDRDQKSTTLLHAGN
jgi:hypothetical protein